MTDLMGSVNWLDMIPAISEVYATSEKVQHCVLVLCTWRTVRQQRAFSSAEILLGWAHEQLRDASKEVDPVTRIGYISPTYSKARLFFHRSSVLNGENLETGRLVSFRAKEDFKGLAALDVAPEIQPKESEGSKEVSATA